MRQIPRQSAAPKIVPTWPQGIMAQSSSAVVRKSPEQRESRADDTARAAVTNQGVTRQRFS
jgi:hypothetical protein